VWLDAYEEFWWADRFGWTPQQTDELGVVQAHRLRVVAGAIDEGRQKAQTAATKET
jgi:hypothetical protein